MAYWKGKKKGRSTVSRSCREIGRKFSGCSIFRNDTSFYHLVNSIPGTVKGCALDRKNRTFEGLGKNSPPLQPRSGKSRITDGVRFPLPVSRSSFRDSFLPSIEFIEQENRPVSKFSVTNRLLCRKRGKKDLSSTFFFFLRWDTLENCKKFKFIKLFIKRKIKTFLAWIIFFFKFDRIEWNF